MITIANIYVLYAFGALIERLIMGLITRSINKNKNYDGGFAWGFFLGIIGIIVVAVRPYNDIREQMRMYQLEQQIDELKSQAARQSNVQIEKEKAEFIPWKCVCGAENFKDREYCTSCFRAKKDAFVSIITPANSKVTSSNIKLLQQIEELHDNGILTDQEYQDKKKEILAKE